MWVLCLSKPASTSPKAFSSTTNYISWRGCCITNYTLQYKIWKWHECLQKQPDNHKAVSEQLCLMRTDVGVRLWTASLLFTAWACCLLACPGRAFWLTPNVNWVLPGSLWQPQQRPHERANWQYSANHSTLICRRGKGHHSDKYSSRHRGFFFWLGFPHTRRPCRAREATTTWYKEIPRCIIEHFAPSLIAENLLH